MDVDNRTAQEKLPVKPVIRRRVVVAELREGRWPSRGTLLPFPQSGQHAPHSSMLPSQSQHTSCEQAGNTRV